MKWNSKLYDNAQAYVSEYGKDLLSFVPNNKDQKILDLGCGTGDLTNILHCSFENIIGIDSSAEMIAEARKKYPDVKFEVADGATMAYNEEFDVVFSNAVFHWIKAQTELHNGIYNSLKRDGLLVCEFGAKGNIAKISDAFNAALKEFGKEYVSPYYFPSDEAHSMLIESCGFEIEKLYSYDRPTPLPNGELGLRQWVSQFFSSDLLLFNKYQQERILQSVESMLQETMFIDGTWVADYRRLRVIAHKN